MRSTLRRTRPIALLASAAVMTAGLAVATPAQAITGGQPDSTNAYSNVAMITFYAEDAGAEKGSFRYRCTGTLISPAVILTAAHCTDGVTGSVLATFDWDVATDAAEAAVNIPRAADDELKLDADGQPYRTGSATGFQGVPASYQGTPAYVAGTAHVHPLYSDFTDTRNWNDVGVVTLDAQAAQQVAALGIVPAALAPANYLDQFAPKVLNSTLFTAVGYGTEVRKPDSGPQTPTPQSYPLVRRSTQSNGQKLTGQILQVNGNENNIQGGGGTCFGDSGGPSMHGGFVVTVTSYGYTNNCRYIDGLQRVDIPVVQQWLAGFGVTPAR